MPADNGPVPLRQIGGIFLRFGLTAFGGPAAHIALFRREFVEKRKWLGGAEFNQLLAISNLLPGPTSTELALHIGYRHAGVRGLLVAGAGFITPAVVATILLASLFQSVAQLPGTLAALAGLHAAVAGLLLAVALDFVRGLQGMRALGIALLAAFAFVLGLPLVFILGAGALARSWVRGAPAFFIPSVTAATILPAAAGAGLPLGLQALGVKFLQIGATLFGSGYVLFAYLDAAFVKTGFVSEAALADAVAVGQITPGPLFSTAAYIGYLLHGIPGGVIAAAAIFAPAFLFAGFAGKLLAGVERHPRWNAALQGAAFASAGLLAGEAAVMAARLPAMWQWALAALAFALLLSKRVPAVAVLLAGAAAGYVLGL